MSKGFTIIETLVAITVLTLTIMGAMSAVQSGLSSYVLSKQEVQAFYLAQEGFEEIRNIRDTNIINGQPWLSGIAANASDPCYFGSDCTVSPVESNIASRCANNTQCAVLREDAATGFFGYNAAWTPTIFTRYIEIASVNASDITVTVTIAWNKGGIANTFKAKEDLYNW